ncbi:SulP family inorganic anion transporter [Croceimicrobium hydrocarbonivorans]|uniref:SulP family inorganic anion transporter n=1 Tax=Croceimicrobium hydrocarbonivorans TaxID=2761580 RepID=A0A7H0VFW1_9FLAO|nr:SulP family inorganic anion transporter [Croceimicrobium hydrocarbonivorans]QNR24609.1 SulP family inorganic anion transporter [Croceimicrobium hydrocarbonivorans]
MTFKFLKEDLSASLVVFLVAVPLCLGIAVASGASPLSGLIAGLVGGIVVGSISGSQLSVSGPAAGLTAIVLDAITSLPTFNAFLLAVVIAGVIQFLLGSFKAGVIGYYFPTAVIKGMLSAIGLILILKQIPHALGDDKDYEGDSTFIQFDDQNTFTEIVMAIQNPAMGAVIISLVALALLILFDSQFFKRFSIFKIIPPALLAVLSGVGLNSLFSAYKPEWALQDLHLVSIPTSEDLGGLWAQFSFPDWSHFSNPDIYMIAITIALVASIETLLSIEATDKLDPKKRITPANRELQAQGVGNMLSGLLGGLPVTAVIVRSSANISSGAQTKLAAIFHGVWIVLSIIFLADIMNLIPLSALAAVLLVVGYKLVKPSLVKSMYKKGLNQFIPFVVTIVAILLTDLLIGIGIGMVVMVFYILKSNFFSAVHYENLGNNKILIRLNKDVSFLNKAIILNHLEKVHSGAEVTLDARRAEFIDMDIQEVIDDFVQSAPERNIKIDYRPFIPH